MKNTVLIAGLLLALCLAAPAKADCSETYTGNAYTNISCPKLGIHHRELHYGNTHV